MKTIKLERAGFSTTIINEKDNTMDINIQILHTGDYVDMNGTDVHVDKEVLLGIRDAYNLATEELFASDKIVDPTLEGISIQDFDNRNAPLQTNHDASNANLTTGHFIGLLSVMDKGDVACLVGKARVKGIENITKVKDRRFRNVSIQYSPDTYEFVETSWVVKGADSKAQAVLAKGGQVNKMLPQWENELGTIALKKRELNVMRKQLDTTKYLMALCKSRVIDRAQANEIKKNMHKFENPKEVISLLESLLPRKEFKAKLITDRAVLGKLYDQTIKTSKEGEQTVAKNLMEALSNSISNASLGASSAGVDTAYYNEVRELSYADVADKHAELMTKCGEAYDSGDTELGKSLLGKAKKLAEDMKCGKTKLSDYDIEAAAEESDEVKKLSEEVAKKEKEVKDEVDKKLAAFEEKLNVALSANVLPKDEVVALTAAIVKLTEFAEKK